MPEDLHDDELGDDPNDSNVVKTLRQKAREAEARAKALEEQAASGAVASRRLAFAEAGVPLADPRAKYFVNGYDGEQSAEAIRAEWANFSGSSQTTPNQAADMSAMDRMAAASQGASAADSPTKAAERAAIETEIETAIRGITDPYMAKQIAIQIYRSRGIEFAE